ncbi:hypothetical protein [Aeromonas media]|uniref:hypothetical protein n=1 Tax=Aeromonas media TaxID=651 RepID=UPI003D25F8B2
MSRTEIKRRLAALAELYALQVKPIHTLISFVCIVEQDDPRMGSWELENRDESSTAVIESVSFYCRDLEQFNQLRERYNTDAT